jgi:hypothetical protein
MLELLLAPSYPGETVIVRGTDQAEVYTCAQGVGPYGVQGDFGGGDDVQPDGEFTCNIQGAVNVLMGDGNDQGAFASGTAYTVFIDGGAGNDNLFGAGGYCELRGGEGNDTIHALCTRSLIYGGPGTDTLEGRDRGADRFAFTPANSPAGPARDTVRFFNDGFDKLVLLGDADRTRSGAQAYRFAGRGTRPGAGQIMWYPSGRDKIVTGFDGRTRFEIRLEAFRGTLDALDFAR